MASVQWKKLVLSEGWLQKLDKVTERRFHDSSTAQEASTYVLDQLSENNWQRLQSFSGSSQPETYLFAVSNNLIEEFSRRKFGRLRPPEWLKREGNLWVSIWQLHCLERQSRDEIIQKLCSNALRYPRQILAIIQTIRSRLPGCGSKMHMLSMEELAALLEGRLSFNRKQQCYTWLNRNAAIFSQWIALVETLQQRETNVDRKSSWQNYFSSLFNPVFIPLSALAGTALFALLYFQLPDFLSGEERPVLHLQPDLTSPAMFIEELQALCQQQHISLQEYAEIKTLFTSVLNSSAEAERKELNSQYASRLSSKTVDHAVLCEGL